MFYGFLVISGSFSIWNPGFSWFFLKLFGILLGNFRLQSGSILQRKAIDRLMEDFWHDFGHLGVRRSTVSTSFFISTLPGMNLECLSPTISGLFLVSVTLCGLFRIIAIPKKVEKRHPTKILANYLSICLGYILL